MAQRALNWRIASIVTGIILVFLLSRALGGPEHTVTVDWAMWPELEGAVVEIDGDSVGTLAPYGQRKVTGFAVDEGEHSIRVRSGDLDGLERTFTAGFGGGHVRMMLDVESVVDEAGRVRDVLVLH
ncbi:MAG: hypothetical protein D6701_13785 [Gemmatimonadetes bacterium]|nr:MAG: hypothetical protein D6701_13785 [Gemmatimonadota bacterium]